MILRKFFLVVFSCSVLSLNAVENPKVDAVNGNEKDIKEKLVAASEHKKVEMEKKQKEKETPKQVENIKGTSIVPSREEKLRTSLKENDLLRFNMLIKENRKLDTAIDQAIAEGNIEEAQKLTFLKNYAQAAQENYEREHTGYMSCNNQKWLIGSLSCVLGVTLGWYCAIHGQWPIKPTT
jgi:transcription initiation factor IIF auxiliary subunit